MTNNEDEAMAQHIGNIGGDQTTESTENTGLGRLMHKSSYGAKEDLTQEEEASKEAFLKRSKKRHEEVVEKTVGTDDDVLIAEGWIPVDRSEMGIRSKFYPEDWMFYIRPATTQAIKNWIGIDEKNALQLNTTFDEIIKMCVRIKSGSSTISWSHMNTWDRFWFILEIRKVTFTNSAKSVTFEDNCPECDQEMIFELTPEALHYEFPDEDIIDKHWNAEDMTWNIDLEEYGVDDHDPITLHTPTLQVQKSIIDWAQRAHNRNKKIDEVFVSTYLPWLISKPSRDDAQMDKMVQRIEKEYKTWSVPCHELMNDIIRNITINPKETLKKICPHCGEEVISNVQFPNGIKVLFTTETKVQKFGSR